MKIYGLKKVIRQTAVMLKPEDVTRLIRLDDKGLSNSPNRIGFISLDNFTIDDRHFASDFNNFYQIYNTVRNPAIPR